MKKILVSVMMSVLLFFLSCDEKKKCSCRDLEDCIDGQCVLKDNCFYINNQGIIGNNLYHGVVRSNICVDTLAFDIDLDELDTIPRFTLFVNLQPWGLTPVSADIGWKISNDEYVLGSGATICRLGNKEWYPSYIHCKISLDSVQMTIKFLEWFDSSGEYVDSCQVTLYK